VRSPMRRWFSACAAFSMAIVAVDMAYGADVEVVYAPPPQPVAAPFATWTGCFLGANTGIAASRRVLLGTSALTFSASSAEQALAGGVQMGCDYQVGPWVLGVQGMFDGTGIRGGARVDLGVDHITTTIPDPAHPGHFLILDRSRGEVTFLKESWFGTASARIGYTIQPAVLLYLKGGGAWAREYGAGWAVGTGVEWKALPNLSFFVEYNYTHFDSGNTAFSIIPPATGFATIPPVSVSSKMELQAILFGANFRFDWGPPVTTRY
jgi:outer membrane immunogenic protein